MKINYLFILCLIPLTSFSQFDTKKKYNVRTTNESPKIDGVLDDKVWNDLDIAKDFTQIRPNNGRAERENQKTEVKICYDNKNIYFGLMMYDSEPDSILKELSKRDNYEKNCDFIGIFINPFNGETEYEFVITAAGIQADAKITMNNYDNSWNAVWKSAVDINNKGWSAEIAIPFSQLRFPNDNKDWSLNISRSIRRYREDYSWNPIDMEYQNFSLQAGLLSGIKNIDSPLRLSFMPYASIYADSYSGETTYPYNYGMDLKYGINESFTLDMTLIPDFGQVSADAMVLNLSPFEVKYEEKRQFFNEGIELFNKGGEMFYSRRLEDNLLNASKISGRTKNGIGIAALNAITNKTDDKPLTNYNVMIIDKALKNSSSVSLMNTNMTNNTSAKDANVTGLFARISNNKNTHGYVANLKMSQEFEEDNSTVGFSGMLAAGKTSGNYRYELYTEFEDDKYNPNDLGFLYSNNEISNGLNIGYQQINENKSFIRSSHTIKVRHETLFTDNKFVNLEFEAESDMMLKNYLFINVRMGANPYEREDYYEARTGDLNHPLKRSKSINLGGFISSDYRNKFALDFGGGGSINPLYSSHAYRWRISPRYRFNDKISMVYVLSIRNKFNDIGYVDNLVVNEELSVPLFSLRNTYMITNVLSGSYIINNKIDFSFKLRYHLDQVENIKFQELDNNGYLSAVSVPLTEQAYDINYTTWTSDVALNWWFAPGSQLSIVWKNGIDNETNILRDRWLDNIEDSFNLAQENSLSLKIVYYLDYLYFKKKI